LGANQLGSRDTVQSRRNQGDSNYCQDHFRFHVLFLNYILGCVWFDSWLKQF
jgi:hypothetical protein